MQEVVLAQIELINVLMVELFRAITALAYVNQTSPELCVKQSRLVEALIAKIVVF